MTGITVITDPAHNPYPGSDYRFHEAQRTNQSGGRTGFQVTNRPSRLRRAWPWVVAVLALVVVGVVCIGATQ